MEPPVSSANSNTAKRVFCNESALDFVAEALRRNPAKQIARQINASPRTVEGWRGRKVAPSLAHFLNACQAVPELKAAMRQLLAMEGDADPEFQRALADLVRAAQRAKP